jgi:hypothetical protein
VVVFEVEVVEVPPPVVEVVFVVFDVFDVPLGAGSVTFVVVPVFVAAGVLFCIQKYAPMPMTTRSMIIATVQPEPPSPPSVLFPGVLITVVIL